MDEKTKELIAIGTSIGSHCQPCLEHHVSQAKKLGIDDEKIQEAIKIGHMVEKGAMNAMREFSSEIMGDKEVSSPASTNDSSCCG